MIRIPLRSALLSAFLLLAGPSLTLAATSPDPLLPLKCKRCVCCKVA